VSAYVIFFVEEISDPEQLEQYKQAAHPTLRRAGGVVRIAYGRQQVLEGAPLAGVVMVEFPSYEAAHDWYHSAEYQEVAELRTLAARAQAVIVDGLPAAAPRPEPGGR
jgi:uncharacterized protein (DUF1330 family)